MKQHVARRTSLSDPAAAHPVAACDDAARPGAVPAIVRILRRDVALVVVVKVLLIAVLYLLFFSPAHRPDPGSGEVAERLLPSGPPP